jgi:signal peptidase II
MKLLTKLFFLFVALVALDQITKYIASPSLCNKNLAWNLPLSSGVFYFVWLIIVTALIYALVRTTSLQQKMFLTLILTGAISNILDRVFFGCVRDYIDLKFWPVFNLGDIYITIGIMLLLLNLINTSRETTP